MTQSRAESQAPTDVVHVQTSARLHFGFLEPSGRGPRPFGSFGVSIDRPLTRVSLRHGEPVEALDDEARRAQRYLDTLAKSYDLSSGYKLTIHEAIPPHSGLGSGTQLALAVGAALAALERLPLKPLEIASRLDRGARSGIGIAAFESGGVVLDGGPGLGKLPPLLCRFPFPSGWRVLLIFDSTTTGIHGAGETAAFAALPEFQDAESAELCRRVLLGALPALAERDFNAFTAAIGFLQSEMGRYFGPLQGGAYVSAGVGAALEFLSAKGLKGIGQSSWGPTGFAFVSSEMEGKALLAELRGIEDFSKLRFELARGRNQGASISMG